MRLQEMVQLQRLTLSVGRSFLKASPSLLQMLATPSWLRCLPLSAQPPLTHTHLLIAFLGRHSWQNAIHTSGPSVQMLCQKASAMPACRGQPYTRASPSSAACLPLPRIALPRCAFRGAGLSCLWACRWRFWRPWSGPRWRQQQHRQHWRASQPRTPPSPMRQRRAWPAAMLQPQSRPVRPLPSCHQPSPCLVAASGNLRSLSKRSLDARWHVPSLRSHCLACYAADAHRLRIPAPKKSGVFC